uniref:Uncharacterized protein n=1 Tax=Setaria italica TaxID=4555 RepID=K3ZMM1_SETIT
MDRYKKDLEEKMREIVNAGSITNLRCPVDDIQGPWKLNKLHGWVMTPMKQGIRAIFARVPKKVFLGVLDYEIVIDFENLHRLYRHQHLDANLVTVWCL